MDINKQTLMHEVNKYSKLNRNKNNKHIPLPMAVQDALMFIEKLPKNIPHPTIMVSECGELILCWDEKSFYIEISMVGDGTLIIFADYNGSKQYGDILYINEPSVIEAVESYINGKPL